MTVETIQQVRVIANGVDKKVIAETASNMSPPSKSQSQESYGVVETPVKSSGGIRSPLRSPFRNLRPLSRLRKRRSRSAPAKMRRHNVLEEHFRIDRERQVVLPGVPKHEQDWARDVHDFFNLIVLIPIVVLNVMNWNWEKLLNVSLGAMIASGDFSRINEAWTGQWFDLFFGCTVAYFVADLLWVLMIPNCVRSPMTIIQHHVVTLIYVSFPWFRPHLRWVMGACMSVEINTWFLIARRVFNKQGFSPWIIDLSFVSIRVKLISICFYLTWISIRCILYPVLMIFIIDMWWTHSIDVGTKFNLDLVIPCLHSTFCVLNLKWTHDLLMSKLRYLRRKGLIKDENSKGL